MHPMSGHAGHERHSGHPHPAPVTHAAAPQGGQAGGKRHGGHDHVHMIADFRRRFWVSLALTIPILLLSHGFWELFGLRQPLSFPADQFAVFVMASVVYFYGGWPFLTGMVAETGTLTEGRFGVSDIVTLAELDATQGLRLAAALEANSSHPIATGIVQEAGRRALTLPAVNDVRNLPGRGLEATIEGQTVRVVSPGYLREHGIVVNDERVNRLAEQGKTVVFVLREQQPAVALALADIVRAESREAVRRLQDMGIRCMMLTGDAHAVAAAVAKELGLDDFFAEVLPDQKAAQIRAVRVQGLTVAMVGDGVNDAPALVEADLGIAIGAGTEVAVESADVVLVRNDPRDVAAILGLSRATYRKMVQNLWWATGYNAVAIPLAAGVAAAWGILLQPALGAVFMSVSTIIVAINAKLLERSGMAAVAVGV